jgi:PAS domain S-box-containing protein
MDTSSQNEAETTRILLISPREEDFYLLRDLLSRSSSGNLSLDHVRNVKEAIAEISRTAYTLLLCDFPGGNLEVSELTRYLADIRSEIPVILLTENLGEAELAAALWAGSSECIARSDLRGTFLPTAIRCARQLRSVEQQHEKAEETLRLLWRAVEQSADLILITDRHGTIQYANPAFEALTGYSREELIGQRPRILQSGQQPPSMYAELWQTISAGNVYRGVLVNRKKNGEHFFIQKTITPVRDGAGEITHFISNDCDITAQRLLERELFQAQKMEAIGKLAGGVAHDFNNLLLVISAYAELMFDKLDKDHSLRKNVTEIIEASRRAAELTRQLLAFGRKQVQALQVLDLNQVLQNISKTLPRLIGEDIQLEIVAGKDLDKIKADPVQIEQIVMNLATNARDAMPHGGRLLLRTLGVRYDQDCLSQHTEIKPGEYTLLEVSDNGQGIAPEHLPHIFEPFYTTKEEGKGTGLGLATVYGIVKQNGGYVYGYSEPGAGTTIKIYFPCTRKLSEPVQSPERSVVALQGTGIVLLVEDSAAVRRSVREFLQTSGYTVLEAVDGEDGLHVARQHAGKIDLMITDVVMPRMSGYHLAEQLVRERPGMEVLFMSGYAENAVLQHGTIDLRRRFLQKPFTLQALAAKIQEILPTEAMPQPPTPSAAKTAAVGSGR